MPRLGAFRAELGASVQLRRHQAERARHAAAAAVRTAGSAQRFHRAHRETPWRAASALASALSQGGARTPLARVGSMRAGATHCPPSSSPASSRSPSQYLPSAMAWPHPRPHPTLVADSLTFTSTPALAPARSPSPHSTARADVGCWARVWARLVRSATLRSEGSWLAAELLRAGL